MGAPLGRGVFCVILGGIGERLDVYGMQPFNVSSGEAGFGIYYRMYRGRSLLISNAAAGEFMDIFPK
jgi:hypothetical protein